MLPEYLPWPLSALFHTEESSPPAHVVSPSSLLHHYETPGISPPSSRIGPSFKRQEAQPMRIWDVWKYGAMVAFKGACCTYAIYPQARGHCNRFSRLRQTLNPSSPCLKYKIVDLTTIHFSHGNCGRCALAFHMGSTQEIMGNRNDFDH